MEVIIVILILGLIFWHLDNKPKRKPNKHYPSTHSVKRPPIFECKLPPQPKFGDPFMSAKDKLEHLQSPYWSKLRLDRLVLANNCCELCNSTETLELHHTTYDRLGCEKLSDVVILCGGSNGCHQLQHDHYGYDRTTDYHPLIKPKLAE